MDRSDQPRSTSVSPPPPPSPPFPPADRPADAMGGETRWAARERTDGSMPAWPAHATVHMPTDRRDDGPDSPRVRRWGRTRRGTRRRGGEWAGCWAECLARTRRAGLALLSGHVGLGLVHGLAGVVGGGAVVVDGRLLRALRPPLAVAASRLAHACLHQPRSPPASPRHTSHPPRRPARLPPALSCPHPRAPSSSSSVRPAAGQPPVGRARSRRASPGLIRRASRAHHAPLQASQPSASPPSSSSSSGASSATSARGSSALSRPPGFFPPGPWFPRASHPPCLPRLLSSSPPLSGWMAGGLPSSVTS